MKEKRFVEALDDLRNQIGLRRGGINQAKRRRFKGLELRA